MRGARIRVNEGGVSDGTLENKSCKLTLTITSVFHEVEKQEKRGKATAALLLTLAARYVKLEQLQVLLLDLILPWLH